MSTIIIITPKKQNAAVAFAEASVKNNPSTLVFDDVPDELVQVITDALRDVEPE